MKFKKYLETVGEVKVSIATKDGRSYVYIGENDFNQINELFEDYLEHTKLSLAKHCMKRKSLILNPPVLTGEEKEDDLIIISHASRICKLCNTIRSEEKYIAGYKPLADRKVVEHYERECEEGIAIIIDGSEIGKLWFESEKNNIF